MLRKIGKGLLIAVGFLALALLIVFAAVFCLFTAS